MANRAYFDINADGLNQGFASSSGQALNLSLRDAGGVRSWVVQVWDPTAYDPAQPSVLSNPPRASKNAPLLTLVGSTSGQAVAATLPTSTITTTMPVTAARHSYLVRSIVDGGQDSSGRWDPTKIHQRMIALNATGDLRKVVSTERMEWSDNGWADALNEVLAFAGTPADVFVTETFGLSGVITPAAIAGTEHNYAPTGNADATVWRLSSTASQFVTGLVGGVAGRILVLVNVGANEIKLSTQNTNSTAANRIGTMPGAAGDWISIMPNDQVTLWYDGVASRWLPMMRSRAVLGEKTFGGGTMAADDNNIQRAGANYIPLGANAGPFRVGGVNAGTDRELIVFYNSGSNIWGFAHEAAGATAANRLTLPGGMDLWLPPGDSMSFIYDAPSSRWRAKVQTGHVSFCTGVVTPAQITTGQNDYAPTGYQNASYFRLNTSTRTGLTGLAGGANGKIVYIENVGSNTLVIFPESAGSAAANRFSQIGPLSDIDILPGEVLMFRYDSATSRWKNVGRRTNVLGTFAFGFALTANVNDLNRFGASHIRCDPDLGGPWKLTGTSAGTEREELVITNVDQTGGSFRISSEDAGSTAALRFRLPVPEIILRNNESAHFIYDTGISRWVLATPAGQGYPGDIQTASALTADQDNFNFSGFITSSSILRVSANANGRRITGISATGVGLGRVITVVNIGSSGTVVLQNESSSSSAGNRLALPFDQIIIPPGGSVQLFYDTTSTRWRPFPTESGPCFIRGANITDADQTLTVAGGVDYQVPFGLLTATRNVALGNAGPPATGTVITIRRFDKTANPLNIRDLTTGGTIRFTFPASTPGEADFRFDGTNWQHAGYKPYMA